MQKYFLIKEKMKNLLYLFVILIAVNGCQSVQDGLSGSKKENSDEFLVQKKNPLVLPPDYDKLPVPKTLEANKEEDVEFVISDSLGSIKKTPNTKTTSGPLEKSIIEKIKKN
jgi:hypothetical protein